MTPSRPVLLRITLLLLLLTSGTAAQQKRFLFDASKAEMAGNADWVIDTDIRNLGVASSGVMQAGRGNESNPQRIPTPAASLVTATTPETFWTGAISAWAVELARMGHSVETLPYDGAISFGNSANPQDLANYDVFIVCEPNIAFTASERQALLAFVQNGGGLFMVADHMDSDRNNDGIDSPRIWNAVMAGNPFGMSFNLDDVSLTSSNLDASPTDSLTHGPAGTVTQLKFSGGATTTIDPAANPSVLPAAWTSATHTNANVMVACALHGAGRVVGLGDSSPADDGTGDPNDGLYYGWTEVNGNHARLIINASIWLSHAATTVPVEFASVTAVWNPVAAAVLVRWETATETNNRGFILQEWSPEDQCFIDIPGSFVPGRGTTTVPQRYEACIVAPAPGGHVYRLTQIDMDGSRSASPSLFIDVPIHLPDAFTINGIHPSPWAGPRCTVEIQASTDGIAEVTVTDLLGRVLHHSLHPIMAGHDRFIIDRNTLPQGVHIVTVRFGGAEKRKPLILLGR